MTHNQEDGFRLSPQQEQLWKSQQIDGNTYISQVAYRIQGNLDRARWHEALARIVDENEIFHTVLGSVPGIATPLQFIREGLAPEYSDRDIKDDAAHLQGELINHLLAQEAESPFDLRQGPTTRIALRQLSLEETLLVVTTPTLFADLQSLRLFVSEIAAHYQALLEGEEPEEAGMQYADVAEWMHELLDSEDTLAGRHFWHQRNIANLKRLKLTLERQEHDHASFSPEVLELTFDELDRGRLKALAKSFDCSERDVLLTCWHSLLFHQAGQKEVFIGVSANGRKFDELSHVYGLFSKYLPLFVGIEETTRFSELLEMNRKTLADFHDHLEFFDWSLFSDEMDPSSSPYSAYAFEDSEEQLSFQIGDLRFKLEKQRGSAERYTLKLSTALAEPQQPLCLLYDSVLLSQQTVSILGQQLRALLLAAAENPDVPLVHMNLLGTEESVSLLKHFNDTALAYGDAPSILRLFEQGAVQHADRIATVFDGEHQCESFTFTELNQRANQLAHYLRQLGVGRDDLVGLSLQRSVEMVIGVLAILKAGGAYVPLDPSYPAERLAYMVENARLSLVITQTLYGELFPGCTLVCLDRDTAAIIAQSAQNLDLAELPQQLLYMIYTSGSTGRPKGVLISREAALNHMLWMRDTFGFGEDHKVLQKAPLSFDASAWEMFVPLICGSQMVIARPEAHGDPEYLVGVVERLGVNTMQMVPSLLSAMFNSGVFHPGFHLKLLFCAGEALPAALQQRVYKELNVALFTNMYGPTEASIDVSFWTETQKPPHATVPIGKPLANTKLYLVDQYFRPVPTGIRGKLLISGIGMARGYYLRPELTAEKFIPDPFSDKPGARLYDSGDLALFLAEGCIEFSGRIDHQVKVRGYRIELEEIQAVQKQHPGVAESLVLAHEDAAAAHLVSYITPHKEYGQCVTRYIDMERNGQFEGYERHTLDNGMVVFHEQENVTEYSYGELFKNQSYLRDGITIEDGDVVFDVGANIGLFTLFAAQIARNVSVYSFEPIPAVYDLAERNARLYAPNATVFPLGVADKPGSETFTYFPNISNFSGRLVEEDAADERAIYETVVANTYSGDQQLGKDALHELMRERFRSVKISCGMTTISTMMGEHHIEKIDLLKIEAEKSETDVLNGIEQADWPKIKQLIMEVDDRDGALARIEAKLRSQGFKITSGQNQVLKGTRRYSLSATRIGNSPTVASFQNPQQWFNPHQLSSDVRAYLQEQLPDYMVPSHFMVLDAFPLAPNGKIDLKALPTPEVITSKHYDPPTTETEVQLASIWHELLNTERVGIREHFFEMGGHSLLATQVISRARKLFQIELPIQALFEHPTVKDLARVIDERVSQGRNVAMPLHPVSRDQPLPASYAQQRLWLTDKVEGSGAAYNMSLAIKIRGDLNIEVFNRSINDIIHRHESLRTHFSSDGGGVFQIIKAHTPIEVSLDDLREMMQGKAQDWKDQFLERRVTGEAKRLFDLSRGPLYRVNLMRLDKQEYLMQWCMHHIISDGWSMGILFRDFAALYEAYARGKASPLKPLTVHYADFAWWQRQWLQGAAFDQQVAFWKQNLDGLAPLLELPWDHQRSDVRSYAGDSVNVEIGHDLLHKLRQTALAADATLYMVMLATLKILLMRYSGSRDIAVGSPLANRTRVDLEDLVGFFINMVILRDQVPRGVDFKTFLAQLKKNTLSAFSHQDLPFEQVIDLLKPDRLMKYTPFVQVVCTMDNTPQQRVDIEGLAFEGVPREQNRAVFDLVMSFTEHAGGMSVTLDYSLEIFKRETMERMVHHYMNLITRIVEDPSLNIDEMPLVTPAEKSQILEQWNMTDFALPKGPLGLHVFFAKRAAEQPDAIAVILPEEHGALRLKECCEFASGSAQQELSYGELDRQSTNLAHHLRAQGVSLEDRVGICLERSPQMVVALLAVLKSGAAYVPLDTDYPADRLAYMVEDAQIDVLLTHSYWATQSWPEKNCLCLDQLDLDRPHEDVDSLPEADGGRLAYLIYTSGSTGRPKGVMIEHRSAINHMLWMQASFGFDQNDKILQKAPLSFDASVWEIFAPLMLGAQLVLARPAGHRDPDYLVSICQQQEITIIQMVPSQLATMYEHEAFVSLKTLRYLFCAGEAMPLSLQQRLATEGPARNFCNMYGPTEATIDVTYWPAQKNHSYRAVPIGKPLSNTQIYLLDENLGLAPVGVRGRLMIAGMPLARGYLGKPALTAERFLPHPYGTPGSRLYVSGDLARYLDDGNIDFQGRADHQVKLRGFRIELGEIEARLNDHPYVSEALVCTNPEQDQLIAYYIPDKELAAPTRNFLRRKQAGELDGYALRELPNGLTVVHQHDNVTDYAYTEIFDDLCYLRHGITINPGDMIFDIGANIGLFTLFASTAADNVRVFSFEPIPAVHELASINASLYSPLGKVFNMGVADVVKEEIFTYFPLISTFSGRLVDENLREEREIYQAVLRNTFGEKAMATEAIREELMQERLASEKVKCQLTTVSEIIRQEGIDCIDLLKVDAEKSELDVLAGIDAEDWPKIKQLVLEIHDVGGDLDRVKRMLEGHGFEFVAEQDDIVKGTVLYNVYAWRADWRKGRLETPAVVPERRYGPGALNKSLRAYLGASLPEYMIPGYFVGIDSWPRAAAGKIDRKALPKAGAVSVSQVDHKAPRNEIENSLSEIWTELLGIHDMSITENFFEIGGHSLLATQVISRARKALKVELPIQAIFEAPTIEKLAQLIQDLKGGGADMEEPLAPRPTDQPMVLSFGQERMWVYHKLEGANPTYNLPLAMRMTGNLNGDILKKAMEEVVQRHEVLRTSIQEEAGSPKLIVEDQLILHIPVTDLRDLSQPQREERLAKLLPEEAAKPFNFTKAPFFRVSLIQLRDDEHILLLTMHHIITDGWSLGLMTRELGALYEAFVQGKPSPLAPLSIQYSDYAWWHRNLLDSVKIARQLAYWKSHLSGLPPSLELSFDRPRPEKRSFLGKTLPIQFPKELSDQIAQLNQTESTTMYISLLAVFKVLLYAYSGQTEIAVGSSIAGRNRQELEGLIGYFSNVLVLANTLADSMSFRAFLARVKQVSLEAFSNQDIPFEAILEALNLERNLSYSPLYQVAFTYQNAPLEALSLPDVELTMINTGAGVAAFDLTLNLTETPGGIAGSLQYSSDLFDQISVERMIIQMQTVAAAVIADPNVTLGQLREVVEAELRVHRAGEKKALKAALKDKFNSSKPEGFKIHKH